MFSTKLSKELEGRDSTTTPTTPLPKVKTTILQNKRFVLYCKLISCYLVKIFTGVTEMAKVLEIN